MKNKFVVHYHIVDEDLKIDIESVTDFSKAMQNIDNNDGNIFSFIEKNYLAGGDYSISRVHTDLRILSEDDKLAGGWTNDTCRMALKYSGSDIIFPIRDKFLANKTGDEWISKRKQGQDISLMSIVSTDDIKWTGEQVGQFLFKASGYVTCDEQSDDYCEYFLEYDQDEFKQLDGKYTYSLIEGSDLWVGRKSDDVEKIYLSLPILKVGEKQVVIGPVLVPNKEDMQKDIVSKDDIEEAAYNYMEMHRNIKIMHEGDNTNFPIVESYIYRKLPVKEGSWILGVKVKDKKVWDSIKSGELSGFSIGGTGTRRKVKCNG